MQGGRRMTLKDVFKLYGNQPIPPCILLTLLQYVKLGILEGEKE